MKMGVPLNMRPDDVPPGESKEAWCRG